MTASADNMPFDTQYHSRRDRGFSPEEYRSEIDRRIKANQKDTMLNGSSSHAAIVVERLFAHARDKVRILSKSFTPEIYADGQLIDRAKQFLSEPGRTLEVMVEDPRTIWSGQHAFFKALVGYNEVKVYWLSLIHI